MAEVSKPKKWKYISLPELPPIYLRVKPATVHKLVPRKRTKGTGSR